MGADNVVHKEQELQQGQLIFETENSYIADIEQQKQYIGYIRLSFMLGCCLPTNSNVLLLAAKIKKLSENAQFKLLCEPENKYDHRRNHCKCECR